MLFVPSVAEAEGPFYHDFVGFIIYFDLGGGLEPLVGEVVDGQWVEVMSPWVVEFEPFFFEHCWQRCAGVWDEDEPGSCGSDGFNLNVTAGVVVLLVTLGWEVLHEVLGHTLEGPMNIWEAVDVLEFEVGFGCHQCGCEEKDVHEVFPGPDGPDLVFLIVFKGSSYQLLGGAEGLRSEDIRLSVVTIAIKRAVRLVIIWMADSSCIVEGFGV